MARTEAQTLADTFDTTRQLNRFYLSNLKAIDPYTPTDFGGLTFNSIYWLTAHLIHTEDTLIIKSSTGTSIAPDWLQHYQIGSNGTLHEGHGDYKSLLDIMKQVHEQSMIHLRGLTDEQLAAESTLGFGFGPENDKSVRMMIMHAIRHEGTHIGNLAYLCKMNGIKMV